MESGVTAHRLVTLEPSFFYKAFFRGGGGEGGRGRGGEGTGRGGGGTVAIVGGLLVLVLL